LIQNLKTECKESTRIIVEEFNDSVNTVYEGSLAEFDFVKVLNTLDPTGGTCLYNVIFKGLDYLQKAESLNKIFICMTDGINTTMPQYQPFAQKVVADAPKNKTSVFFIGNNESILNNASESGGFSDNTMFTLENGILPPPLVRAITREASCGSSYHEEEIEQDVDDTLVHVIEDTIVHVIEEVVASSETIEEPPLPPALVRSTNVVTADTDDDYSDMPDLVPVESTPSDLPDLFEPPSLKRKKMTDL